MGSRRRGAGGAARVNNHEETRPRRREQGQLNRDPIIRRGERVGRPALLLLEPRRLGFEYRAEGASQVGVEESQRLPPRPMGLPC